MIGINVDLLIEALQRVRLPKKLKRLIRKPTVRHMMKKTYGNKAFLLPDEEKFPVIDPETGKYDCRLIFAAYVRAKQWEKKQPKYKEVARKAKKLYEKLNCEKVTGVAIRDKD